MKYARESRRSRTFPETAQPAARLAELPDLLRADALRWATDEERASLGQYFTPPVVARLMASMLMRGGQHIRVLDPGAGVGALTAAWVEHVLSGSELPESIEVVAYEIDPVLLEPLRQTLQACAEAASSKGVSLTYSVVNEDFILGASDYLRHDIFGTDVVPFDCAILNPPYRKLNTDSAHRRALAAVGIEVTNLYAAFVALAVGLLKQQGEFVAITPRSFCNGTYFAPFRSYLIRNISLERIHVFGSRASAFAEDAVLQENIILKGSRHSQDELVEVTSSAGRTDDVVSRSVPASSIVREDDPERVFHIPSTRETHNVAAKVGSLASSLDDLDIQVSTGRVVDFRARPYLLNEYQDGSVPLIYPGCVRQGAFQWPPGNGKKPVALRSCEETQKLVVPPGVYVLVKRFTSKEERRRIVAAVVTPDRLPASAYAFENHINYFHQDNFGMDADLAHGLAAYLNCTDVDEYFRSFSGHTQVNAGDLRRMRYPDLETLRRLGARVPREFATQAELDNIVASEVPQLQGAGNLPSMDREERVAEALAALTELGLPREQQNDRSALALLALLDLTPSRKWKDAQAPTIGVTPIMEFAAREYGRAYAPNTRETFRRFTLHQFVAAGLVVPNPDKPKRATNSPKYCYQIEPGALEVLRSFGSPAWEKTAKEYVGRVGSLKDRWAQARAMERIPLRMPGTKGITLSPGGQNELVVKILDDFCPHFTPDAEPVYVGDTDDKWAYFNKKLLARLGVHIESHGKMPDVVVYLLGKEWLVLIEAVTSHGPVNPKRHEELSELFAQSTAGLVFVTAFLTRRDLTKYLGDIAWETEVWVAESPTHLIHFNGIRFLGPYTTYKKTRKPK